MNNKMKLILRASDKFVSTHVLTEELRFDFKNATEDEMQEICDRFEKIKGMRSFKIDSKVIYVFFTDSIEQATKEYKKYYKEKIENNTIIGAYTEKNIYIFNMHVAEEFYMFYETQRKSEEAINFATSNVAVKEYLSMYEKKMGL